MTTRCSRMRSLIIATKRSLSSSVLSSGKRRILHRQRRHKRLTDRSNASLYIARTSASHGCSATPNGRSCSARIRCASRIGSSERTKLPDSMIRSAVDFRPKKTSWRSESGKGFLDAYCSIAIKPVSAGRGRTDESVAVEGLRRRIAGCGARRCRRVSPMAASASARPRAGWAAERGSIARAAGA